MFHPELYYLHGITWIYLFRNVEDISCLLQMSCLDWLCPDPDRPPSSLLDFLSQCLESDAIEVNQAIVGNGRCQKTIENVCRFAEVK